MIEAITSEGLVVGAVINDSNLLLELSDLKLDYFTSKLNKIIYASIKRIYGSGTNIIDIADIYALIEPNDDEKRILDNNGGLEYLEQLRIIGEGKSIKEVRVHAKNIVDAAFKNEVIDTMDGLSGYVNMNRKLSLEDISNKIDESLLEVKGKYSSQHKVKMIGEKTDDILKQLEIDNQGDYVGYPTSLPTLNKFITYRKSELVIYSAKAKVGKSQLVVNETYNLAIKLGIPVMILDTELQTKTFFVRLMARITGYSFRFIEQGRYRDYPKAYEKVKKAKQIIDKSPISHTYIVGWNQNEIFNEVKRMKIQNKVGVLFYDYIKVEDIKQGVQEHQVLGNITNWLKNKIAGELDIAVVALAQMSDYSTEERGIKIANSEKIKNYASSVVFLIEKTQQQYADDFNEEGGNAYLYVNYNRNGVQMLSDCQDIGINILFEKNKACIEEAPYQHEEIIDLINQEDEEITETSDGDVMC